ncbi:MAG: isoprenylcysteine carboxylmethyltransferase family protein [Ginsengibacter sp.]
MTLPHYFLIFIWTVYYIFHSIFASLSVKNIFQKSFPKANRYYRLCYSILAAAGLILILIFQYSFDSPVFFHSILAKYLAVIFLVIPGSLVMIVSLKKYFLLLSGVRSVFQSVPSVELKVEGIHRLVRHPLYSGTILWVWGLFFLFPMINNLIAVVLLTLYVIIGIRFEEKKLLKQFGSAYSNYASSVPMLIPRLIFKK